MDHTAPAASAPFVEQQPWKKWLSSEMGKVEEGASKAPWQAWKPNKDNPGEKPWLIWNAGEGGTNAGMRDDRPHNATCYNMNLKNDGKEI